MMGVICYDGYDRDHVYDGHGGYDGFDGHDIMMVMICFDAIRSCRSILVWSPATGVSHGKIWIDR